MFDDSMVSVFETNSPRLMTIFRYSLAKALEVIDQEPKILAESETSITFRGFDAMRFADLLVQKMRRRLFRGEKISLR